MKEICFNFTFYHLSACNKIQFKNVMDEWPVTLNVYYWLMCNNRFQKCNLDMALEMMGILTCCFEYVLLIFKSVTIIINFRNMILRQPTD